MMSSQPEPLPRTSFNPQLARWLKADREEKEVAPGEWDKPQRMQMGDCPRSAEGAGFVVKVMEGTDSKGIYL